jgi:hypothetical protein
LSSFVYHALPVGVYIFIMRICDFRRIIGTHRRRTKASFARICYNCCNVSTQFS